MKQVSNRQLATLSKEDLEARLASRARCLIDVGTGDGRFAYRYAAEHPDTFCIGIDPVAEAMREASAKALKKPARGGLPNVLYLMDAAETLPGDLEGVADLVTFNYPWGSLLGAWLMLVVGTTLGPPDPATAARTADDGTRVPIELAVSGHSPYIALPAGALLGLCLVFIGLSPRRHGEPQPDARPETPADAAAG